MSLSQWDLDNLSPEDQQKVLNYKDLWQSDPSQRESAAAAAAQIRAKYGYSGGPDGSQYIPIDTFKPPTAPTIPQYESPYKDQINDLFEQIKNPPKYESPYADLINQQISQIVNRPQFSYDPDNDPAYQAFKQRALRAGDKAYADNLGGLSAMTGGRPNSWAATVASQARNQYVLQAEEAVIHFEDRAYSRYRDETADMYNLVNLLNSQDEIAYSRFRDAIGDTKDLAGLVLQLDDREFEQYKYMAENQWRNFEYEYNAYKDSLTFKKDKIAEAIDRTNLLGYVNNQDSITLGVPSGTLSQAARERAEAMEDYIKKTEIDLKNEFKKMEESHKYDLEIIKAKERSDLRMMKASASLRPSGRSGGSGGSSSSYNLTASDGNKRDKLVNDFVKYTESKDFQRLSADKKYEYVAGRISKIVKDANDRAYGKNSEWVANAALGDIMGTKAYQENFVKYENFLMDKDRLMEDPIGTLNRRLGLPTIVSDTVRDLKRLSK